MSPPPLTKDDFNTVMNDIADRIDASAASVGFGHTTQWVQAMQKIAQVIRDALGDLNGS